jgi:HAD superfamily phosphoserine phosphatase-like hydrolase
VAFSHSDPSRGVALFDLDGTLLPWDCQLLFCHRILREHPWRRFYLGVFLPFTPLAPWLGAETMKRIFLCYLWRMDREEIQRHARELAASLDFYPELLEEIARHRREGRLLILASASPEFYVAEIGKRLGFDLSLGTPVGIGAHSPFFPDLDNHKGEAKVHRLRHLLPATWFENGVLRDSHGYTDSTADLPMLEICENATLVNPSPMLTAIGEKHGWAIIRPTRPWRSTFDRMRQMAKLVLGI